MTIIEKLDGLTGRPVVDRVTQELIDVSSSDADFRQRLEGPIYDENTDVARFILATLSEDAMTKETRTDLWVQEKGHFVWTIEHILPQGTNLPKDWLDMLGGRDAAAAAQEEHVHRLGNLTITAYNSTLSNKSFPEKRDRTDPQGRSIGYRNGLSLNADLATKNSWTVDDIEERTTRLASQVIARFPLP
ncbi:HNH endonuclease family protein [Pseudonocardia acidicola]|uniref:HNH endonuclease family protein n=1 Tax=Pseudonocardia acidicola TaxID=2724939 RepID=UPI001EEF9AE4|nr:HNH endonuclease family protein [Pseudonocardia acidicola]